MQNFSCKLTPTQSILPGERFSQVHSHQCSLFTLKPGLAHFRWLEYRGVLIAQQEIAPEAKKTFHSRLLMSLNTESEQDP